jgi:release factor glutamine methyltransferase
MLAIKDWLDNAASQLGKAAIVSSRLDAEIILAYSIKKPRTYLHAHSDELLDVKYAKIANSLLSRRLSHEPIAYIVGYKYFYGRKFIVTPDTLIPRPESEDIIVLLKRLLPITTHQSTPIKLVDVGTGCGCLGITAKLELPFIDVSLTDISDSALSIAKQNAEKYGINVNAKTSDLLLNYSDKPDIIIANLPYVYSNWDRSPETNFEPQSALFADDGGLAIIKKLITQTSKILQNRKYLIIEADPTQHNSLIRFAEKQHLIYYDKLNYIIVFVQKVAD